MMEFGKVEIVRVSISSDGPTVTGFAGDPSVAISLRERAHFSTINAEIDMRRTNSLDLVVQPEPDLPTTAPPEAPPALPATGTPT